MHRWKSVLVLAYVALQLALPARGFLEGKFESRGNFSWNMYADVYGCQVTYTLTDETGRVTPLDVQRFFNRPDQFHMVLHKDVLPKFHAWLCKEAARRGLRGQIRAEVRCKLNGSAESVLVDEVDVCGAPNFGVKP